jgi:23S rRNA pseudouridine2605 synthase
VQIRGRAESNLIASLIEGVRTDAGLLRIQHASILRQGVRNSWLEIALEEGKNRHIRRMMEGIAIEVLRLVRVAVGPLPLGDLPKGAYRELTQREKHALDVAIETPQIGREPCPDRRTPISPEN